jgi:hypothetical protein
MTREEFEKGTPFNDVGDNKLFYRGNIIVVEHSETNIRHYANVQSMTSDSMDILKIVFGKPIHMTVLFSSLNTFPTS